MHGVCMYELLVYIWVATGTINTIDHKLHTIRYELVQLIINCILQGMSTIDHNLHTSRYKLVGNHTIIRITQHNLKAVPVTGYIGDYKKTSYVMH